MKRAWLYLTLMLYGGVQENWNCEPGFEDASSKGYSGTGHPILTLLSISGRMACYHCYQFIFGKCAIFIYLYWTSVVFNLLNTLLSSLVNNSDSLPLPIEDFSSFTLWVSERPLIIVPHDSCLGLSGQEKQSTTPPLAHDRKKFFPGLFRTRVEQMALLFPCIMTCMYCTWH